MRKEFLGRGWKFPFGFDPASGGVALSEFEENIQENITVILGTKPGERQKLPEFGCRIHELMFAPTTRATANLIERQIERALRRWEPRVNVDKVEAWPDDGGQIKVLVHYTVISTEQAQELNLMLNSG